MEMSKWLKLLSVPILIAVILFFFYFYSAESRVKGPTQPILFSHKIHAGENKMPCEYCHSYVEISTVPGIPSVQKCIGCHLFIIGKDELYDYDGKSINIQKEIEKVKGYWDRNEPIPWVKVNRLQDFVHFNHKRHIRREIECKTCHGEVSDMDVVHQVNMFSMGWCVSCHQKEAKDAQELTMLRDCLTCHY
jgi:hypothetical protein